MSDHYGKVVPLYRDLDPPANGQERIMRARYPPTGDPGTWVRNGPDPDSRARNWDGRDLAEHDHAADEPGDDCARCGFPWWPDARSSSAPA